MRVAIADDELIVRDGLAALLLAGDVEVTARARTADELVTVVLHDPPDAVILDIRMPPTRTDEGLVAAALLRSRYPALGILVLSAHVDIDGAVRLLAGGTAGFGYLLKERIDDVDEIIDALDAVVAGKSKIDPSVIDSVMRRRHHASGLDRLSAREREVIRLTAQGQSNMGIAETLSISLKAVEANLGRVFTALAIPGSRAENRRVLAVLTWLRDGPG